MTEYRKLSLRSAAGEYRIEKFEGRDHIVVPVVALMEGVIWASNAPKPEYVPLATLQQSPDGWNGRPVMLDHPSIGGEKVTANTPATLDALSFGKVFATAIVGTKLTMEAWLDPEKAALIPDAQVLIDKIKSGEAIEVSVGAYIALSMATGFFGGVEYFGVWIGLMPDHLALLPVGTLGACSNDMGCGVRTASRIHTLTAKGIEMEPVEEKKPRGILAMLRSALRSANLSPTVSDQDIKDELREALNKLEPSGAYIIAVYSDRVIFDVYEDGSYVLYSRTYDNAYKLGDRVSVEFVGSYVPTEVPDAEAGGDDLITATRRLLKAAAGARHSAADNTDIKSIHDLSVQLGAACSPTVVGASGTKPCGCGQPAAASTTTTEGDGMKTKPERIAALMAHTHSAIKDATILDTLSDAALAALEVSADAAKTAAAVPVPAAPAAPKTLSEAEVMSALPESVKRTLARAEAVEKTQKAALVTALKGHSDVYTEDALNAMTIESLQTLAKFAKLDTPSIDFGALPVARSASADTAPAPDGYAAPLAAHGATIQ